MTVALISLVDRELTEQCCRQWVGFIAPIRVGKKTRVRSEQRSALRSLRSTQCWWHKSRLCAICLTHDYAKRGAGTTH